MSEKQTLKDLRDRVDGCRGVLTVTMEEVRDAYGAQRLGSNVRTGIENELASLALGHYPQRLPDSQSALVRLYRLGSPVANLIIAVLNPTEEHDEDLRRAVASSDSAILQKIKELVCD